MCRNENYPPPPQILPPSLLSFVLEVRYLPHFVADLVPFFLLSIVRRVWGGGGWREDIEKSVQFVGAFDD